MVLVSYPNTLVCIFCVDFLLGIRLLNVRHSKNAIKRWLLWSLNILTQNAAIALDIGMKQVCPQNSLPISNDSYILNRVKFVWQRVVNGAGIHVGTPTTAVECTMVLLAHQLSILAGKRYAGNHLARCAAQHPPLLIKQCILDQDLCHVFAE
ncbi:hypothetical protein MtrunA17_Chr5g0396931 [Medicago truncatula]|uniref:Transmembrane protein, putative n=1 Tax=Medicago truncatula TaxID=3880 RepID=G7KAN9_MEDTR|nr:transmembrane protein, putative [Medicago truncatula]RHN53541.1 hypothetical protein MtrunA17_Chr5g0396931 [Medicago truncatula]